MWRMHGSLAGTLLAVCDGWWRLTAAGSSWRLAVGGGLRLAVGGLRGLSLRAVLNKIKWGLLKESPARTPACAGPHCLSVRACVSVCLYRTKTLQADNTCTVLQQHSDDL